MQTITLTTRKHTAFLTLVAGWLLPAASPWVWTRFVLGTVAIPALLPFFIGLSPRRRGISVRSHIRGVLGDLGLGASQIGLSFTFLAYQSWLMADAILRTLGRLFGSQRSPRGEQLPPGQMIGGAIDRVDGHQPILLEIAHRELAAFRDSARYHQVAALR